MSRQSPSLTQAEADATRAAEEALIIYKSRSRTERNNAVIAATSVARFQQHPDDLEEIIATCGARASGRMSPTERFVKNKRVNARRKAIYLDRKYGHMEATETFPIFKDDSDDDYEPDAPTITVRHELPATIRIVTPVATPDESDEEDEKEGEEDKEDKEIHIPRARTPYPGCDKAKATGGHMNITGKFKKLKFLVGGGDKKEKKAHGSRRA
ncbi:uncharacterized protein F4812DRAFT_460633 [Daldinia caldariorum]|uniref:uncharacterized protein n=1 Tax=Daldinia caldariorum TaxID=326644 RepID=UPI002007436C|nr:uncharacterized protein F4812DRAFT_460633 [Daldinia caldariorum]KAI1466360.1 hypothetical protein F4812DRAFT_460633 [Daldinia caldariorum]